MKDEVKYRIEHGKYVAEISSTGAALSALTYMDSHLIEPRKHPRYFSGEILAPWPNRIADGCYNFAGTQYNLDRNEASRNNALHGLVFDKTWDIVSSDISQLTMKINIDEPDRYPGELQLEIRYSLDDLGLMTHLIAKNISAKTLPYGASTHPYIVLDDANSVDEYTLQMGSSEVLLTDSERLLPTILVDVEKFEFDFRTPRLIGDKFIDHAFKQDPALPSEVLITGPSGNGVSVTFSESAKWIQIHTADRDGGADSRKALAVEPMTCPPDSFNSRIDLIEIEPGGYHEMSWRIKGI